MRDALGRVGTVLVLGGTSEIGLAIARDLVLRRGVGTVLLAGRDKDRLGDAADSLEDVGATVRTYDFDASSTDLHGALLDEIFDEHEVDVTILAFGLLGNQALAEHDPSVAVEVAQVNYVGTVSVGLHLAEHVERQGHGDVVVLSSVAGDRARRDNYVYGSTKAGLDAFAQGLGDRLAGAGGHVLVVRPGFVHTRMTVGADPAPFSTTAGAVATDVVDALDRRRHVVYSPRILRILMVLLRMLPRPIFRAVARR